MSSSKLALAVFLSPAVAFVCFSFVLGPVAITLWLSNIGPNQHCVTGTTKFSNAFGGIQVPLDIHKNLHDRRLLGGTPAAASGSTTAAAVATGSLGSIPPTFGGHGYKNQNPFGSPSTNKKNTQAGQQGPSRRQGPRPWWDYHSPKMADELVGSEIDAAWRMKVWLLMTGVAGCILGVFEFFVFVNDMASSKAPLSFPRLIGTSPRMWELLDVIGVVLLTFTAAILIVWHVIGSAWTWGPDGLPCRSSKASKLWNCMNGYLITWWLIAFLTSIGLSVNPVVLSQASIVDMLTSWAHPAEKEPRPLLRFTPGAGPPVAQSKTTQNVPIT